MSGSVEMMRGWASLVEPANQRQVPPAQAFQVPSSSGRLWSKGSRRKCSRISGGGGDSYGRFRRVRDRRSMHNSKILGHGSCAPMSSFFNTASWPAGVVRK